jgi:cobalt/nickel transport system permease protein
VAHIPDGFLSAPVMAGTAAASVAGLAVAVHRSRRHLAEREAPVLGAATAFVFAAQMLNFPLGAGTSAHLLGGVLVGTMLGPWAAMLVLFAVVLVQALLFQDGGIGALGANTLNMAILGVGGGMLVYRWILWLAGVGFRRRVAAAALAGAGSTVIVGVAVAVELALSDTVPLAPALVAVGGGHALMGIGEGVITGAVLAMVLRARPELVASVPSPSAWARALAYAGTTSAVTLAIGAAYLASSKPDALEAAAARLGIHEIETAYLAAPFADYTAPLGGALMAAVIGVVAVFTVAWVIGRAVARRRLGA